MQPRGSGFLQVAVYPRGDEGGPSLAPRSERGVPELKESVEIPEWGTKRMRGGTAKSNPGWGVAREKWVSPGLTRRALRGSEGPRTQRGAVPFRWGEGPNDNPRPGLSRKGFAGRGLVRPRFRRTGFSFAPDWPIAKEPPTPPYPPPKFQRPPQRNANGEPQNVREGKRPMHLGGSRPGKIGSAFHPRPPRGLGGGAPRAQRGLVLPVRGPPTTYPGSLLWGCFSHTPSFGPAFPHGARSTGLAPPTQPPHPRISRSKGFTAPLNGIAKWENKCKGGQAKALDGERRGKTPLTTFTPLFGGGFFLGVRGPPEATGGSFFPVRGPRTTIPRLGPWERFFFAHLVPGQPFCPTGG
ncbi:hypothetical protein CRENBAI_002674 [Crenichthys baileyi]|uniref:Uncharacterized protein n=1 Tax=Crenichthys baileyi TaxID=28760 RepID=A0AAV9SF90_9TELE